MAALASSRHAFLPGVVWVLVVVAGCGSGPGGDGGPDGSADAAAPGLVDGEPCTGDAECGSGWCLTHSEGRWCARACEDEDECGASASCGFVVTLEDELLSVCRPPGSGRRPSGAVCVSWDDCDSTLCIDALCVERCTSCDGADACVVETLDAFREPVEVGICRWRSPGPDLELGPVGTPGGMSTEIFFEVPPGVTSFVVTAVDDDGLRVGFHTLVAPDGTVLLDLAAGGGDLIRANHYPGATSVLVPNTDDPAAALQVGTYSLVVGTFDPGLDVPPIPADGDLERVAVTFETVGEEGGILDLNFFFAPGTNISAVDAEGDPFVTNMLVRTRTMLDTVADLRIGDVRFVADLDPEADSVETSDEIRALCAAYSEPGSVGPAVNILLVNEISFTSGFSGGIPAPPGIYGTSASCLVVERFGSGNQTGVLLTHELGHMFGLFHTTEAFDSTITDPISDTPECAMGTPVMSCPDYFNLLFPIFPQTQDLVLSPAQRWVLRGYPALYEINRPAACAGVANVYDVTAHGFGTGDSDKLTDGFAGSCGGVGAPERVQMYRLLTEGLSALELRVVGVGFAPLLHVRWDECEDVAAEVACDSADADTELLVTIPSPQPGGYFLLLDGRDGVGGSFSLTVTEVP